MAEPFKWNSPEPSKPDDGGKGDVVSGVSSSSNQKIKESIARNVEFNKTLHPAYKPAGEVVTSAEPVTINEVSQQRLDKIKLVLKNHGMDSQQQEKAFAEIKNILSS